MPISYSSLLSLLSRVRQRRKSNKLPESELAFNRLEENEVEKEKRREESEKRTELEKLRSTERMSFRIVG
jgi:hypothetical protein